MNPSEKETLWEKIPMYRRRNAESINPPSERINPDAPGAHFWVILATNWSYLHPLIQDVLTEWYRAISKIEKQSSEGLDPESSEMQRRKLEELSSRLQAYEIEKANLEEEITIRDRDFQTLRSLSGKKEKESIELQQELGKSFQVKIIEKQQEIDEKAEIIEELKQRVNELEADLKLKEVSSFEGAGEIIIPESLSSEEAIQDLKQRLDERNVLINEQAEQIQILTKRLNAQSEKLKEFATMTKGLREEIEEREMKTKEYLRMIQQLREENKLKEATIKQIQRLLEK